MGIGDAGIETVSDEQGAYQSNDAAPVKSADSLTASEDATPAVAVLANDCDADGDRLSLVPGSRQVKGFTTSPGLAQPAAAGPTVDHAALLRRFALNFGSGTIQFGDPSFCNFLDAGQSLALNFSYRVTNRVASETAATLAYTIQGTFETVPGRLVAVTVAGGYADDSLAGVIGVDLLRGGAGNDSIDGGAS